MLVTNGHSTFMCAAGDASLSGMLPYSHKMPLDLHTVLDGDRAMMQVGAGSFAQQPNCQCFAVSSTSSAGSNQSEAVVACHVWHKGLRLHLCSNIHICSARITESDSEAQHCSMFDPEPQALNPEPWHVPAHVCCPAG